MPVRWWQQWTVGWWRVLVAAYTTFLFAMTHIPVPPVEALPVQNDKLLHFLAYGALAGLWGLRPLHSMRGRVGVTLGLMVFAALDEATQPWFGRTADYRDWLADVVGIVAGIAVAGLLVLVWTRILAKASSQHCLGSGTDAPTS